jgi:pilus assembly protein CpaD
MFATARKDRLTMARSKSIVALLAIGVAVGAFPAEAKRRHVEEANRTVNSIHQPVVVRTDLVLDLVTQSDGLSVAERGRLHAWFASLGLGYGDRVFVDEAYGPSQARNDVARAAAEWGMLLKDGAPVTMGAVQPGSIRVVVSRSTASVPSCPYWSGRGGINSTSPNYGCATNSNLAAMIADPSDLVLGQAGSGTADAANAAKAIKVYRDAPPTGQKGLTTETPAGGN